MHIFQKLGPAKALPVVDSNTLLTPSELISTELTLLSLVAADCEATPDTELRPCCYDQSALSVRSNTPTDSDTRQSSSLKRDKLFKSNVYYKYHSLYTFIYFGNNASAILSKASGKQQ